MKRVLIACAVFAPFVWVMAGCSTIPRYEAANDIHAFLVSIRDGDRPAFDAHVDKPALKTNLKARVMSETAHQDKLAGLATLLAGPLLNLAVDAAMRPEVFKLIATDYGYDAQQPLPNTLVIAQYVRPLDGGRACVTTKAKGSCVFIFKNEDGTWKLIDFEGHIGLDKGKLRMTE
jgi:hypothetical protein